MNIQLTTKQEHLISKLLTYYEQKHDIYPCLRQKIDELSQSFQQVIVVNNLVSLLLEIILSNYQGQVFITGDSYMKLSDLYDQINVIFDQQLKVELVNEDNSFTLEENALYLITLNQMQKISTNKQKYHIGQNVTLYFCNVETFNQSKVLQIQQLYESFFISKSRICLLAFNNTVNVYLEMYLRLLQESDYKYIKYEQTTAYKCLHQQLFVNNPKQSVQLIYSLCSHINSSVIITTRSNFNIQNIYQELQQVEYDSYFDSYAKNVSQYMSGQNQQSQSKNQFKVEDILVLRQETHKGLKMERLQRVQTQSNYVILSSDAVLSQLQLKQPDVLISIDIPDNDYLYNRFHIPKFNFIQIVTKHDDINQLYLTFLIDNGIKVNRKYTEKLVIQRQENDKEWLNQVLDLL